MWNLIGVVLFPAAFVYVVIRISDIYNLLSGVSDDIYDIKKKLGLETDLRTKSQEDDMIRSRIKEEIYDGKDSEELKNTFGATKVEKHKWWIDLHLQEYSKKKICPQ